MLCSSLCSMMHFPKRKLNNNSRTERSSLAEPMVAQLQLQLWNLIYRDHFNHFFSDRQILDNNNNEQLKKDEKDTRWKENNSTPRGKKEVGSLARFSKPNMSFVETQFHWPRDS
ncbi:hypothetical protein TNIN_475471 [Trichonephila inaurata madagascariensis]|uniref:Uncharacterized protein n=1 Tax=Trichonephila inaurata madagascariensis TaxID=2747483 RepID=A0A8X6XVG6_9ARAC|nr:hypothetical protein TNIN_475471 [Trichonephila inaurata madagascariensis]